MKFSITLLTLFTSLALAQVSESDTAVTITDPALPPAITAGPISGTHDLGFLDTVLASVQLVLSNFSVLIPALAAAIGEITAQLTQLKASVAEIEHERTAPVLTPTAPFPNATVESRDLVKRADVNSVIDETRTLVARLESIAAQINATAPLSPEVQTALDQLEALIATLKSWLDNEVTSVTSVTSSNVTSSLPGNATSTGYSNTTSLATSSKTGLPTQAPTTSIPLVNGGHVISAGVALLVPFLALL